MISDNKVRILLMRHRQFAEPCVFNGTCATRIDGGLAYRILETIFDDIPHEYIERQRMSNQTWEQQMLDPEQDLDVFGTILPTSLNIKGDHIVNSYPFLVDGVFFAIPEQIKPPLQAYLFKFISPFAPMLWFVILMFVLATFMMLNITAVIQDRANGNRNNNIWIRVRQLLPGQIGGDFEHNASFSGKLVIMVNAVFMGIICTSLYQNSMLVAFMNEVPIRYHGTFHKVLKIIESKQYPVITSYNWDIGTNPNILDNEMSRSFIKATKDNPVVFIDGHSHQYKNVVEAKSAVLLEFQSTIAGLFRENATVMCHKYTGEGLNFGYLQTDHFLVNTLHTIYMKQSSKRISVETLDYEIIKKFGVLQHIKQEYDLSAKRLCDQLQKETGGKSAHTTRDLSGDLMLWLIGLTVAMLAFAHEKYSQRQNKASHKTSMHHTVAPETTSEF